MSKKLFFALFFWTFEGLLLQIVSHLFFFFFEFLIWEGNFKWFFSCIDFTLAHSIRKRWIYFKNYRHAVHRAAVVRNCKITLTPISYSILCIRFGNTTMEWRVGTYHDVCVMRVIYNLNDEWSAFFFNSFYSSKE